MEERGLVDRIRVQDDRRVVLVRPTGAGIAIVDDAELLRSEIMHAALGRMTASQLDGMARAAADLQAAIEAELASTPDRYLPASPATPDLPTRP
jgi:DNA-binding MarR family transcriptional regulator